MDHAGTLRRQTRTIGAVLFVAVVLSLAVLIEGRLDFAEMVDRLAAARDWVSLHPGLAYGFAVLCALTTASRWWWGWQAFAQSAPPGARGRSSPAIKIRKEGELK